MPDTAAELLNRRRARPGPAPELDRPTRGGGAPNYTDIAASPEFAELRSALRRFVFPVSLLFLSWYVGFVAAAANLPELMTVRVVAGVNVALLLGLGQFASTLLITWWYVRYARRHIDPVAEELRAMHEPDEAGDPR